jgi:hypothetical protein
MKFKESHKKEIDLLFNIILNQYKDLNFKKEDIIGESRKQPLPVIRRVLANVLYDVYENDFTMDEIASVIERTRATFSHHRSIHLNHCSLYKDYKQNFESIKREFLRQTEKN